MEITQEYLKECFDYNPETGIFLWRLDRPCNHFKDWRGRNAFFRNISSDRLAGRISRVTKRNPKPYLKIGVNGKSYSAHRLAWFYVYGSWPDEDLDHINLNTLDNRVCNLRLSINKLNHRNRSKYRNNSSGLTGVSFNKRLEKWQAEGQEVINGERIRHYLGVYSTIFDAACARKSWEFKYGYSEIHGK